MGWWRRWLRWDAWFVLERDIVAAEETRVAMWRELHVDILAPGPGGGNWLAVDHATRDILAGGRSLDRVLDALDARSATPPPTGG
jgi:hypothetical protein